MCNLLGRGCSRQQCEWGGGIWTRRVDVLSGEGGWFMRVATEGGGVGGSYLWLRIRSFSVLHGFKKSSV